MLMICKIDLYYSTKIALEKNASSRTNYANVVIEKFKETNFLGIITMLDSVLLFTGVGFKAVSCSKWISISYLTFHFLNVLCLLDLTTIQVFLSIILEHLCYRWFMYRIISSYAFFVTILHFSDEC